MVRPVSDGNNGSIGRFCDTPYEHQKEEHTDPFSPPQTCTNTRKISIVQRQPSITIASKGYKRPPLTMDRIREGDRSQLIKVSMVLFSVLAVLSFSLAQVPW